MRTKEMGWQSWQLVAKEWKTYEELHGKWGQNLGERWNCHFSWGTCLLQELLLAGDSSKVPAFVLLAVSVGLGMSSFACCRVQRWRSFEFLFKQLRLSAERKRIFLMTLIDSWWNKDVSFSCTLLWQLWRIVKMSPISTWVFSITYWHIPWHTKNPRQDPDGTGALTLIEYFQIPFPRWESLENVSKICTPDCYHKIICGDL